MPALNGHWLNKSFFERVGLPYFALLLVGALINACDLAAGSESSGNMEANFQIWYFFEELFSKIDAFLILRAAAIFE